MDLYTDRPASELVTRLEKGGVGPISFTLLEPSSLGPRFHWDHGSVTIVKLTETQKEIAQEGSRMRNPCSKLFFTLTPAAEGIHDACQITASFLDQVTGDLALSINGDSLLLERVNGVLSLDRHHVPEKQRDLFKPPYHLVDFPPF